MSGVIQGPPKDIYQGERCKGLEVPFQGLGAKAKLLFQKVNPLVYTVLPVLHSYFNSKLILLFSFQTSVNLHNSLQATQISRDKSY